MSKIDSRQITYKGTIDQLSTTPVTEADNLFNALNSETTPLLRLSAASTPSLVVNVGPALITNPESNRTRSIPPIAGILPTFTSGTVTFPSSTGGAIVVSPGNNGVLTVASGNFVKVLIYMDSTGALNVLSGIQNTTQTTATTPKSPIDTLPIGYIVLQNIGGVIQNITQNRIYQYNIGSGTTSGQIQYSVSTDSTTTGSNTTAQAFTSGVIRLTNASLLSLSGIPAGSAGQFLIIENKTGNQISINNEETTATAANRIQTGTGANVSMPNNSTFMFTYDVTSARWQLSGGSGSGSGGSGSGKNYLSAIITSQSTTPNTGNGNFESGSTAGWSLFNTTLTSGIPTGTITAGAASVTTFGVVSSGQLSGSYSLQTASVAAWSAGQGFLSDAFNIDQEDQTGKILAFKASYKLLSNTNVVNFSGTSANTFAAYIYDVTNAAWIQPAGVYNLTQTSGVGTLSGTFQTTSNSTQYRIAIVCVNASTGSVNMYWDNFSVGPQVTAAGFAGSDAKNVTVTGTMTTNTTYTAKYWQRGDRAQFNVNVAFAGAPNNVNLILVLPFTIDASKLVPGVGGSKNPVCGTGTGQVASANKFYTVYYDGPNSVGITYVSSTTGNVSGVSATSSGTIGAGDNISVDFEIPIVGWSSNTVMSADTDTRVVGASYGGTAGTTITNAGSTIIKFLTSKATDTHGAYNPSTGLYTIPVSGKYRIFGQYGINITTAATNAATVISIYKNGTPGFGDGLVLCGQTGVAGTALYPQISAELDMIAGDTISFYGSTQATGSASVNATTSVTYFTISRISGPATIAASESVNASYGSSNGQSISNGGANTVQYPTKIWDSHNAFNTSTNTYTAPISGKYRVTAMLSFVSHTPATASAQYEFNAVQAGSTSQLRYFGIRNANVAVAQYVSFNGSCEFNMLAGDTFQIVISQTSGSAQTLVTNLALNNFCVERIGN